MKSKHIFILCTLILALTLGTFSAMAAPVPQTENTVELMNEVADENPQESASEEAAASETELSETPSDASETEPEEEEEILPDPPEAPVLENPQGEFYSKAMGFYWAPSLNAEVYELHWENDRGYEDTLAMENDDWTCQMGRCILYAELPSDGNYTWTVSAVNTGGSTDSEAMTFSVPSILTAPAAYRPNAALSNQKPIIFEFEDVGRSAQAYRIQVVDVTTDQIRFDNQYSTDTFNQTNGVCFLETEEFLASGSYAWRVQALGNTTSSNWSSWVAFDVNCTECNSGAYLNTTTAAVYPSGIITETEIQFVWQVITGAQSYQLEIKDSKEVILLDESVAKENCDIELCRFIPETEFSIGESYTWSINAYGWNNSFWGSAKGAFAIADPNTDLAEISFVGPDQNASLDPDNQQIIWSDPGVTTTFFRIGIRGDSEEWAFVTDLSRDAAWCDGITCSIQFHDIPEGDNYEIVVIPYSEFYIPGTAISLNFSNLPEISEPEETPEETGN